MVAVVVCTGLLLINASAAALGAAAPISLSQYSLFAPLVGVTVPEPPAPGLASVFDGQFQSGFARSVGPAIPVFPLAVRLRNQVAYSVFGVSANPALMVGTGRELLETDYVTEYCDRNLQRFMPFGRRWAAQIRQMQDVVERRKQTFLYVVTPSKPAQYPSFIPPGVPCRARLADRQGLVPAWMALLQAAGVHAVDTTASVAAARSRYPFPLFPLGGTHLNAVGNQLTGEATADGLERQRREGEFLPLAFTWTMDAKPRGSDIDLARLMNLLVPPVSAPVPVVALQSPGPKLSCTVQSVVIIGGSFAGALAEYLSQEPCHPRVQIYEYWHVAVLNWQNGRLSIAEPDPATRSRDIDAADVVIYEANEQIIQGPYTGTALYQYLLGSLP